MNSFWQKLRYGHNDFYLGYGKMIASNTFFCLQVTQIYLISWAKHCYIKVIFPEGIITSSVGCFYKIILEKYAISNWTGITNEHTMKYSYK